MAGALGVGSAAGQFGVGYKTAHNLSGEFPKLNGTAVLYLKGAEHNDDGRVVKSSSEYVSPQTYRSVFTHSSLSG